MQPSAWLSHAAIICFTGQPLYPGHKWSICLFGHMYVYGSHMSWTRPLFFTAFNSSEHSISCRSFIKSCQAHGVRSPGATQRRTRNKRQKNEEEAFHQRQGRSNARSSSTDVVIVNCAARVRYLVKHIAALATDEIELVCTPTPASDSATSIIVDQETNQTKTTVHITAADMDGTRNPFSRRTMTRATRTSSETLHTLRQPRKPILLPRIAITSAHSLRRKTSKTSSIRA